MTALPVGRARAAARGPQRAGAAGVRHDARAGAQIAERWMRRWSTCASSSRWTRTCWLEIAAAATAPRDARGERGAGRRRQRGRRAARGRGLPVSLLQPRHPRPLHRAWHRARTACRLAGLDARGPRRHRRALVDALAARPRPLGRRAAVHQAERPHAQNRHDSKTSRRTEPAAEPCATGCTMTRAMPSTTSKPTDTRQHPIHRVGIKDMRHPLPSRTRRAASSPRWPRSTCTWPAARFKGTHMSRFVEILQPHERAISVESFRPCWPR